MSFLLTCWRHRRASDNKCVCEGGAGGGGGEGAMSFFKFVQQISTIHFEYKEYVFKV